MLHLTCLQLDSGAHLAVGALSDLLDLRVAPLNAGAPAESLVLVAQDRHLDLPVDGHHDCGRLQHLPTGGPR